MPISDDFQRLIALLQNGSEDDADAEWKAAIELGNVTDEDEVSLAVTALIQALQNRRSHALIRAHAVESLGILGDEQAAEALRLATEDSYRLVRAYATRALGAVSTDVVNIPVLVKRLNEDDFFGVRAEAASALGNLALRTPDVAIRQQIREILSTRITTEQVNPVPGTERVVNDLQRALERLSTGNE